MSDAVFRSLAEAAGRFGSCALAIGNFDGVHVGHQALLRQTVAYAVAHKLTPAVLTFHPHPAAIIAPERLPEMLCTLDERIRLLHAAGAEHVLVLPFTVDVSNLSPLEFAERVIVEALAAKAVFVGENFRFGHRQSGDIKALAAIGRKLDFHTGFLSPVTMRGEVVSSSRIRERIRRSDVSRACRMLGRPFALSGDVVSGRGIGSKETVPTLNLARAHGYALPLGVFVSETLTADRQTRWQSVTNVGTRPTFSSDEVTIETYLLGPLVGAPPAAIEVRFRRFLRTEQRFFNAAELKSQILRDVARAQAYWRRFDILGR